MLLSGRCGLLVSFMEVAVPLHPDQAHIDQLRSALWRGDMHGNAALMVGAGMSRNAIPRLCSIPSFPTWAELMEPIIYRLYPIASTAEVKRDQERIRASATSSALRTAQEFVAAFGEVELEILLQNAIPDTDYTPSDLHERLLRLRWADVFTTNWDTLLERCAAKALPGRYGLVRAIADLPLCRQPHRPRIIKLHGTLGSARPYILTEEHFRTYPTQFAPFVNTVRQSIMENVMCLIGFSGDDPNFLQWSGWVRDQLGPQAPFIYLVSLEPIRSAQRAVLMERRIVPIDLSGVFPPETQDWRAKALEWFLINLEAGRPRDPRDWPTLELTAPGSPKRSMAGAQFDIVNMNNVVVQL